MELKELRQALDMSQRQFASVTGIPLGTLRNWEQGLSEPPAYVYTMVINAIRRDLMINVETVKFMKMLDELAEKMKRATELMKICKDKLTKTEEEINKTISELS